MDYTLYGARRSGSLIVELTMAELGLEHELCDVSLDASAQREAGYAALNPQRKLPALVTPDGETLTESLAIVLTLDERHPQSGLMPPAGSPERAQALRWLAFVATELYPVVEINDYPERFAPSAESATAVREIARALWRERWLIVERNVAGDPYLLPTGFCLGDIYIAVVSRWAQQEAWRPAHVPKVERLTAAVAARPACAPVWRRHRPDDRPARFD